MVSRSPLAGCLAAVIVVVAGCSAQPAAAGSSPAGGPGALPPAQTPGQDALLLYAEDVLIGRCMAAAGLAFTAVRPPDAALAETSSYPYGSDDVAFARAHGYGFADGLADPGDAQVEDPNDRRLREATPDEQARYQAALYGPPDALDHLPLPDGRSLVVAVRGCVADARRQLYGDVPTYVMADFTAVNLAGHIAEDVRGSPGYVRALAGWRACVNARGLTTADPDAARRAGAEAARTGGRAAEVAVAVPDAECARSTSLVTTAKAAERDRWNRVDPATLRQVVTYRTVRAAALPAARAATG